MKGKWLLPILLFLVTTPAKSDLYIYHLNVNMGDATLIVDTDTKRTLLVDAGNKGYGKSVAVPTLKKLGFSSIHYFVATHYDADHIGGFDELAGEGIKVTVKAYDRGNYTDRKKKTAKGSTTQYGEYLKAVRGKRKTILPSCTQTINLGPKTKITVVASKGHYLQKDCAVGKKKINEKKDNDLSIALLIEHKNFSYFIGGDLTGGGNGTTDMESLIIPVVGDVDVLKLSHHGSATSSNNGFVRALAPEVAVISVGNGGVNRRYRLPRQTVLDRLHALKPRSVLFLTNRGKAESYQIRKSLMAISSFIQMEMDIVLMTLYYRLMKGAHQEQENSHEISRSTY